MLPVTAGKDSRLLFSATRSLKEKVFYYINKEDTLLEKDYDIRIPRKLLKRLGVEYHVIEPYIPIDKDFEEVYFQNNPFASKKYLPIIYNYYCNFSEKVNMPGIFINVVEDVYELYAKKYEPVDLARLIKVDEYQYAIDYFQNWLMESQNLCEKCNINILNLLYWEERVANWGTQVQLDKDIAQDDIIPYNSRLLIETMLAVDLKDREKPDFRIFMETMKILWPETLNAPFNPGLKNDILKLSKTFGIAGFLRKLYYTRFNLLHKKTSTKNCE